MKTTDIWIVDAFADAPLVGNPAGVVLTCDGLDEATFRRIAFEVGFSDSVFVCAGADSGHARLRFFSPYREVDLSGHGTVAAYWLLAEEGRIPIVDGENVFDAETNVAKLKVRVTSSGGKPSRVMVTFPGPKFEDVKVNLDKLSALFGVGRTRISEDLPVSIVEAGMRTLHIPLADLAVFAEIKPLMRGIHDLCTRHDVKLIQVFTRQAHRKDAQVHCRVYAPFLGIEEDPVSGISAASLGAYLARHNGLTADETGWSRLKLEQGEEMGRPGLVDVEVAHKGREVTEIRAGGAAVVALKGKLCVGA
jgi:trans-2,3-dihydro-3-hydroxyanthranilate isomerase